MVKVSRGVVLGCGISTPFVKLGYLDAILWLGIKVQILVCFTKVTVCSRACAHIQISTDL